MRPLLIVIAIAAALLTFLLATAGPGKPTPTPEGSFAFAVLGDAPYYPWEARQYELVLDSIAAHDLAWVAHVGDLFWKPCSEARYLRARREFERFGHPVIYTPGDNEWTDCWRVQPGGYAPLGRLEAIREIFFDDPHRPIGDDAFALETQADDDRFAEFVENVRWRRDGIVFATLHMVGSMNAGEPFEGRTAADDAYVTRRTAAAIAWMRESFSMAREAEAPAVVLIYHAEMLLDYPPEDPYRASYDPFIAALTEESGRFDGPVLVIHGDDHEYRVDRPLAGRPNVLRMEVPGSPRVGWVRVVVTPGAAEPFAFTPHVVPRWKYW